MRQRIVRALRERFPAVPRSASKRVSPANSTSDEANGKTELLFDLALLDLASTRTILSGLRTQAGIGLSALIGSSAFLGRAVIESDAHDQSIALTIGAGAAAVAGLVFLLWVAAPVMRVGLGLPLSEALQWLESERKGEASYSLAGYQTALITAVVNSQPARRAVEVRRANLLRVGLLFVGVSTSLLLVVLFRGP
jgi:hypothetical protein